ncbi:Ig-like domain-containing protein [Lysinibacter sp. HNR]|uniref:Ig-like domain-containing protein n=1 Tax=Lysinibacter sp. HNR TaxID=3031408 RepID=UPI002435AF00|nr:Ig-like domain-containing protein [Lysinibacter sp. HNR]WGD37735.1 Ig-like domain-containing protein [Lysinibacter sp. HNR]
MTSIRRQIWKQAVAVGVLSASMFALSGVTAATAYGGAAVETQRVNTKVKAAATISVANSSVTTTEGVVRSYNNQGAFPGPEDGVHAVTLNLKDSNNNPVVGLAGALSGSNSPVKVWATLDQVDAGITPPRAYFDRFLELAPGQYRAEIQVPYSGTYTVQAKINDVDIPGAPSTGRITFIKSYVEVVKNDALADGTDSNIVRVYPMYLDGRPIPGYRANLTSAYPFEIQGATLGRSTERTDLGVGVYDVPVRSNLVGTHNLTVKLPANSQLSGVPLAGGTNIALNFRGDVSFDETTLSVTQGTRFADGTDFHTATVTVRDPDGEPIPNVRVDFSASTPSRLNFSSTDTISDSNGVASVDITTLRAGEYRIGASISGTFVSQPSPVQTIRFINPISFATTDWSVTAGDKVANGNDKHTATVTVRDSSNNPIPGATVVVSSTSSDVALSPTSATSNANGVATVDVTTRVPGTYTLSATVNGTAVTVPSSTLDVNFIPETPPVSFTETTLLASTGDRFADGVDSHEATVTVRDAQGNPISGVEVAFASTNQSAVDFSAPTAVSGADGTARITITSTTIGSYDISATIGGQAVTRPAASQQIRFVAPIDYSRTTLSATTGPKIANGVAAHQATVTVVNTLGLPVVGTPVSFASTPAGATLSPAVATTDSAGVAVINITSSTVNDYAISATVGGNPVTQPNPTVTVSFVSSTSVDKDASVIVISDNYALANGRDILTATVYVVDMTGAPAPGVTVDFTRIPGLDLIGATRLVTDANGVVVYSATSTQSGTYTLDIKVDTNGDGIGDATLDTAQGEPDVMFYGESDPRSLRPRPRG